MVEVIGWKVRTQHDHEDEFQDWEFFNTYASLVDYLKINWNLYKAEIQKVQMVEKE